MTILIVYQIVLPSKIPPLTESLMNNTSDISTVRLYLMLVNYSTGL